MMRESKVFLTKHAADDLRNLDPKTRKFILDKIAYLDSHALPLSSNSPVTVIKLQGFDDLYRFRWGNYRVIFKYQNGKYIITNVAHRKNAYK